MSDLTTPSGARAKAADCEHRAELHSRHGEFLKAGREMERANEFAPLAALLEVSEPVSPTHSPAVAA